MEVNGTAAPSDAASFCRHNNGGKLSVYRLLPADLLQSPLEVIEAFEEAVIGCRSRLRGRTRSANSLRNFRLLGRLAVLRGSGRGLGPCSLHEPVLPQTAEQI